MKGLSLVLLIVFLIIGVLYLKKSPTTATPEAKEINAPTTQREMLDAPGRAKEALIESPIANLRTAIESYNLDHDQYPQTLDVLVPNYIRQASALNDPWGRQFNLESSDDGSLVIISAGRDGVFGTEDDIKRGL